MKHSFIIALAVLLLSCSGKQAEGLSFDPGAGTPGSLTLPTGLQVNYTAYERLYYVTEVADSTYQFLNVYVPEGATQRSPIFFRTYVGAFMASAAGAPRPGDASGRALAEGCVVVIPGSRGHNSQVDGRFNGRAPAGLLDLKAAVRYLRLFDSVMPGSAERIITDGTSAGGAMSALLGATGNDPVYEPLLDAMGAARQQDHVFASVCYCPIIDIDHADMAYEWLFRQTDSRLAGSDEQKAVAARLADAYPAYLAGLDLRKPDGSVLDGGNMMDYLREILTASAQKAKDAGAVISPELGFSYGGAPAGRGEYLTDLDMTAYLNYVVGRTPLKGVPSFDSKDVLGSRPSPENSEFGDETGSSVNFTAASAAYNGRQLDPGVAERVFMMNPMNFVGRAGADNAPHWYIRHGALDRDTAFPIPVIFATRLQNEGLDVDFDLAWNRPHSGDYALGELFAWVHRITGE